MNAALVILPALAGFGVWLLSRGTAEASAPSLPAEGGTTNGAPPPLPPELDWPIPGSHASPAPSSPAPSTGPIVPIPSSPAPTPPPNATPAGRSPLQAALALLEYVSAAITAGRSSSLGSKGKPNAIVRDAQTDMGELTPDGIYGPSTRRRGEQLTGKAFPARSSSAPSSGPSKPKDKNKAKPKPPPSSPELRSDPVVVVQDAPHRPPLQTGPTVTLERDARYRARLKLEGIEAMASNDQVATAIQANVGPWTGLEVTGTGADRKATGTYRGETRTAPRPAAITELVKIAARAPRPPAPSSPAPPTARPQAPAPSSPAPKIEVGPAVIKRSPEKAALDLLEYATAAINAGRARTLGSKGAPNQVVQDAQRDMGITADGIYGPATRAKGKQLTGKTFPARA